MVFLRDTSRLHNTHKHTSILKVAYPWHPWFGLEVEAVRFHSRVGADWVRCIMPGQRKLEVDIPIWMFDPAICKGMKKLSRPRVDVSTLEALENLLSDLFAGDSLRDMIGNENSTQGEPDVEKHKAKSKSGTATV